LRELPRRSDLVVRNNLLEKECLLRVDMDLRGNLPDHEIKLRAWDKLVGGIVDRLLLFDKTDAASFKNVAKELLADLMEG